MLLYDSPVSGNCYKARLLFAQLGIAYERREVDVIDRSGRPKLLGEINPALSIPTVVLDDGSPLAESNAILWYFAYTHVAHEGGFDLAAYPAIRGWIGRVEAQPGHVAIGA